VALGARISHSFRASTIAFKIGRAEALDRATTTLIAKAPLAAEGEGRTIQRGLQLWRLTTAKPPRSRFMAALTDCRRRSAGTINIGSGAGQQ
jgi:hypothetical protein